MDVVFEVSELLGTGLTKEDLETIQRALDDGVSVQDIVKALKSAK